jgi:Zn-finger nucleic acid-binding protein
MQCPECAGQLFEKRDAGITIDQCETCSGIWFDVGELEAYRVAKGENNDSAEKTIINFKPLSQSKILLCPRCTAESLIFGDSDKFQIARCDRCFGVFVSKQEIQMISRLKKSRNDDEGKFWIGATVLEFIGEFLDW